MSANYEWHNTVSADVAILWNPSAGSIRQAEELRQQLKATPGYVLHEPDSRDATIRLAAELARSGTCLIVAAGGDGTINAVLNGLMEARQEGAQPSMGVLPLGTANDFAFTLGLPADPWEALPALTASPRRLDVVRMRTNSFETFCLNVATGGNAERVTELMTDEVKETWGPFSYLRGAITVLSDLAVFEASVAFDDEQPQSFTALNVLLGNGRTSGGRLPVAPQANPEDGLLDVVVVLDGPAIELVSLGTDFIISDYLQHPNVVYRQARKLRIESSPAMPFSADGEACGETTVDVEVLPQALPIVVGPDYQPEGNSRPRL